MSYSKPGIRLAIQRTSFDKVRKDNDTSQIKISECRYTAFLVVP